MAVVYFYLHLTVTNYPHYIAFSHSKWKIQTRNEIPDGPAWYARYTSQKADDVEFVLSHLHDSTPEANFV